MHLILALLAALLCGCTSSSSVRVDDGLLVELSQEEMEGVRQARVDRDAAQDALAAANLAKLRARDRQQIAKKRREVVRAQLKLAELELEICEERGSPQEVEEATAQEAYDRARLELVNQEITLCKLEGVQAERAEDLAKERVKLRGAQVVLEKARALNGLESAPAGTLSVVQADEKVQKHYERVQELQTRLQVATAEVRGATERQAVLRRAAAKLEP